MIAKPEVSKTGPSDSLRASVQVRLRAEQRQDLEARLAQAYHGQADTLPEEIEDLLDRQSCVGVSSEKPKRS